MVTSHDVARHAGVSQATVSRVLNNNPRVDKSIRERVLKALDETGYVPNAQAKAMRTSRAGAVGIVTSEIQNPFLPYMLDELTRAARDRNLNVIVWNDSDPQAPMAMAGVGGGAVDGVLFMAARSDVVGIERLAARGVPLLLCNRAPDDAQADVVMTDHYRCGYDAARYFVDNGRTSIAAVFGPGNTYASPARERGFRDALDEAGVELRDDLVHSGVTSYETGVDAAAEILRAGDLPDAVFCSSDVMAYGVLDELRERDVVLPDEIWVAGVDGLPMSGWRSFDLTTQRQPIERIADAAIDRLIARIGGESGDPVRQVVDSEWIVRGSTQNAPLSGD